MIERLTLRANGLAFSTRATGPGDGAVVVLLHGFPDHASTFDEQLRAIGRAGYRCVAPSMRGYEPSSQPADGDLSLMALAGDVVGWLDDLGVEQAHVVGHDWGAAVAYVVGAHHPERVRTLTALAIPPLTRIPGAMRHVPKQLVLSWYMTFFQLPRVAEAALRARRWALLLWLWHRWSPGYDEPDQHPRQLIESFEAPGVLKNALAYYRQNATPPLLLGLRRTQAMHPRPITVPTLIAHGDRDGCMDRRLFDHTIIDEDYPRGVRHEMVEDTGHFLHLEAPDRTNDLLLGWFAES